MISEAREDFSIAVKIIGTDPTKGFDEKNRQLDCFYDILKIIGKNVPLDEMLKGVVDLIPSCLQFPETTCARIIFKDRIYQTSSFRETGWKVSNEIVVHGERVGILEVFYQQDRPQTEQEPFLKEEGRLINAITEQLGKIIEYNEVEETLQNERDRMQNYLDVAGSIIGIVNKEQRVVLVNKKGCEVLGYGEEDIIGKNWFDSFLPEQVREVTRYNYEKILTGEIEPPEYFENLIMTRDGEIRLIHWHDVVLRDEDGNIIGTISSGEDITEKKKAEDELSKAYEELKSLDKMKNEFLSNVSHELKTPLVSIIGYSELLHDEKLGVLNEQQKKSVDSILRGSVRLRHLIDSLLYLSMEQVDKVEYEFAPLQLSKVIEMSISDVLPQIKAKGLTIKKDVPDDLPMLSGNEYLLTELFYNLLDNAIKFTPVGGKITVVVREEKQKLKITVNDTGIGISEDHLARLFDRFYQVDASSTRGYRGAGLGLYVSKSIVKMHKGDIWIESKIGVGSSVYVTLPYLN